MLSTKSDVVYLYSPTLRESGLPSSPLSAVCMYGLRGGDDESVSREKVGR